MKVFILFGALAFLGALFFFLFFFLAFGFFGAFNNKVSPFECGFIPMSSSMVIFSLPFFMVTLMFLLFDVEILLLCFFPLFNNLFFWGFFSWAALLLILFSTLYEWVKGVLSWL